MYLAPDLQTQPFVMTSITTAVPVLQVADHVRDLLELGTAIHVEGVTKERFLKLIERFPEHQLEREPNGTVTIMPPTHGGSGSRELSIGRRVGNWAERFNKGMAFGPSTGFDLPTGAIKSPDAAWLSDSTLALLSAADIEERFVPVAPDFVVEIRSGTDDLAKLQDKMSSIWMANGVQLSWLIDPYSETAWVYRAGIPQPEMIKGFNQQLSGEEVMPDFLLDLHEFRILKK